MRPLILLLSLLNSNLPQILCDGSYCDAEKCVNTQPLEAWFERIKDPKEVLKSDFDENVIIDAQPLVSIVPCDTKNALWNYKYAGSKGKRKIFTGKGKITFVKVKDPPHGYDYGMKSGHCLIKNDEQLKIIESEFDAKGRVQGFVKIDYFNNTRVYGHCVDGVLHGITRVFIDEIDEETNLPKSEKRLSAIQTIQNGKPVGSMWTFALNGMKIYQEDPEHADAIILYVPDESNEYEIMSGLLDDDEMIVKAQDAKIKLMTNENGIFKLNVKKCGEMFDYDMQIKEKTDAKMAKMIRFFEYVTIEKNSLESKYQPLEEPVDLKNAQFLISDHTTISGSPMGEQLYKMKCPYDPSGICIAKADGVKPFDSEATLVMYSQLTYQILADQGLVNITSLLAANVSEETFGDFLPLEAVSGLISDNSIRSIQGKFKDGKAEGPIKIDFLNGKTMEGVAKDGALHGIARILEPSRAIRLRSRYIARTKIKVSGISYNSEDKVREVSHCGIFSNGYVSGPAWSFLHGGNFHFGMIQEPILSLTNFTTENGAYINQDMVSAYSGKFFDGKMISGQESKITDLLHKNGVVVPIFDELKGPVFNHITFDQETLIGGLTPDPLEERYVYVNHSVNGLGGMDGGKGLFAKVDIPANTIFAYFGGYLYTASAWNQTDFFDPSYFIKFKEGLDDYFVHLPDEFGDDLNKYAATLGHKINHGWNHNCVFVANNHPRFGLIAAAKSVREIKAGNEILGYYNLKFHEAQPWYQELWRTKVDLDTPEGPFGHREHKKVRGQAINPMLTDSQLYKEFYNYALAELKLDPLT